MTLTTTGHYNLGNRWRGSIPAGSSGRSPDQRGELERALRVSFEEEYGAGKGAMHPTIEIVGAVGNLRESYISLARAAVASGLPIGDQKFRESIGPFISANAIGERGSATKRLRLYSRAIIGLARAMDNYQARQE
mgnify:CR=1 FL=1|jgi:hypothetical protein